MPSKRQSAPTHTLELLVPDLPTLGEFVRARRRALGLSDATVAADRLGVSRRLLLELEQGRRGVRADRLLHILQTLGCDLVIRPRGTASREVPRA